MKKLKILLLTDRLSLGGAETHILSLYGALVACGHSVLVVSSGGELSEGIPHINIDLSSRSPLMLLKGYFRLRSLILNEKFDVVHVHARLPALVASLALHGLNIPLVTTVHARFRVDPIRRRLSTWGFRSVAVSEDLRIYLTQNYGILPENITVIENGVKFQAPCEPLLEKEKFKICFLSRLDSDCSLSAELLLSIALRLSKKHSNIEIVIGGGGERLAKISRCAEEINNALGKSVVRVVGAVRDVTSFLRDCNLFVGVSRSAIEALSFGIPVILAGNEGFLGRLCEKNFILAQSTNFCARGEALPTAEGLFEEISFAIDDYSSALADSRRVYALAQKRLDISHLVLRYESFYREALSSFRHARARGAKTLIFGYYGYSNLGDNALLRSAVERAEREFGDGVAVFAHKPRRTSREFGVRAYSRSSPLSLFFRILRSKRLVFGGGTLFQDSTSRRSLILYLAVLRLAQILRKDTLLYANGIGEIKDRTLRRWTLNALRRCSHIGLRDVLSLEVLKKEGFELPQVVLEDDLALRFAPASAERAEFLVRHALNERSEHFFVVCPHGRASRFERFELDIAIRTQKNKRLAPLFIACSPEDEHLCHALKRTYGGGVLTRLSFSDLLSIFPLSACIISMRYHPLLAALTQGVNYIPIGSDIKLREFERG